jgi:hypothetical protein
MGGNRIRNNPAPPAVGQTGNTGAIAIFENIVS